MRFNDVVSILVCFLVFSGTVSGAVAQSDLLGHWTGSLTDSTKTIVYTLDFIADAAGALSGTGDGRPLGQSALLVKDGSAGTVSGTLHWFYVDTGVDFKWVEGIPAIQLATGQLNIHGTVSGSAYIAPKPSHDTGTWTLNITQGNVATTPAAGPGKLSFNVTQGKEIKSTLLARLDAQSILPTSSSGSTALSALTLTINSAEFVVNIDTSKSKAPFVDAKLAKGVLLVQAKGLNLIELLSIDLTKSTQTIATPISVVGVDASGKSVSFLDGTVTFDVVTKHGAVKGSRIAP